MDDSSIISPIMEIDLHGMRTDEAVHHAMEFVENAPEGVYRIRLIHGYHRGTGIQKAIYEEFDYFRGSDRVLRVEAGANRGVTELILREY